MHKPRTLTGLCLAAALVVVSVPTATAAPATGPSTTAQQSQTHGGDSALAQATGQAAAVEADPTVEKTTDRIIVKFKDGTPQATKTGTLKKADQKSAAKDPKIVKTTAGNSDVVQTSDKLDPKEQDQVIDQLTSDPSVQYAEPDKIIKNATAAYPTTPNDPLFASRQWNLRDINAPQAWQSATGAGQTIGIVDSGITNHPDLNSKVVKGYDFVSPGYDRDGTNGRDSDPTDPGVINASENWHGTHVAGIAGAQTNNATGIAGVAPDAKIEPARVFGTGASGYVSDFADAITWASGGQVAGVPANTNPSTVVNFSGAWADQCSSTMKNAIDGAAARNVPVVVAAGNSGVSANGQSPANCLGAVVVGASASSGVMTGYSNFGPMLDVLAPGGTTGADIYSTLNTGFNSPASPTYGPLNGTSMAAPHVAGVIVLMKQRNPKLNVEQIRNILVSTGTNVSGYRKVNAEAAVKAVAPAAGSTTPVVVGGIKSFYNANGGASKFGTPIYNERSGLINGGVYQGFSKNYTIYWTPFSGSHSVNFGGAIGAKYRADGYEKTYGYPVSEEVSKNGIAYQWFRTAGGKQTLMMWSPSTGAKAIQEKGAIGAKWAALGRESKVGMPASDEKQNSDGGYYQFFRNLKTNALNIIFWTPQTGAHMVTETNGIGAKWAKSGREIGVGYPLNEETSNGRGGSFQSFTNSGRTFIILWTKNTGAHLVQENGAIGQAWNKAGRENGWGYPTTDETKGSDGKVHQKFSKGVEVTWTAKEGVKVLRK